MKLVNVDGNKLERVAKFICYVLFFIFVIKIDFLCL
jgi:hypothetical protein